MMRLRQVVVSLYTFSTMRLNAPSEVILSERVV